MKKYLLIIKCDNILKIEVYTSYYKLLRDAKLWKIINGDNVILKWYRVDNLTFEKLDFICDIFAKFMVAINTEVN